MIDFSASDLALMDEIIGGRYDSLKELIESHPQIVNRSQLQKDIETLRPLVEKIRHG